MKIFTTTTNKQKLEKLSKFHHNGRPNRKLFFHSTTLNEIDKNKNKNKKFNMKQTNSEKNFYPKNLSTNPFIRGYIVFSLVVVVYRETKQKTYCISYYHYFQ